MVVTRRTPVASSAPPSSTPSTQPVPRLVKKTNLDASSVPLNSSPLANGSVKDSHLTTGSVDLDITAGAPSATAKSKGKAKHKKNAKRKSSGGSTSFVELLFRMFLLWFTIYTLSVCPQDEHLNSPVCRGLAEYRRLVIEPYILPPIRQAISHPSVARYVEKAKPYADYALRTAKPIAVRAQKEFSARVVPQWNKRVVPLYHKHAVPQLMKLEAQTAPYRLRVEQEYKRTLAPYLHRTAATLYQWQHEARPYVVLAAEKTYQGYQVARPYARPLWERVMAVIAQLAAILGEQRRQYVDPHVQKIWEHVKELSNGQLQTPVASHLSSPVTSQLSKASSQVSKASGKISSAFSSITSSVVSGSSAISQTVSTVNSLPSVISKAGPSSETPPVGQTTEGVKSSVAVVADKISSAISSASDALESSASMISASVSPSFSSVVSAASDAVVPPLSSLILAADPVAHEAASSVAHDIPSIASNLGESGTAAVFIAGSEAGSALSAGVTSAANQASSSAASGNLIPSSASDTASVTVTPALASVPKAADSLPSIPSSEVADVSDSDPDLLDILSDPDLEAFKAELGLTDDLISEQKDHSSDPSVPVEESESEAERIRARREKTERERADITQRHTAWEEKVIAKIAANKKALRKSLVALRKAAVAKLKDNVAIRGEIDGLIDDAEKFLRGAEKYLANLRTENRKTGQKKTLWDRVLGKIEEKFSDRLRQTESVVNGWYMGTLQEEAEEVLRVTQEVKDLAERAQADLGLDYAYLDDVTYLDWQRYHDLLRRSDNFTAHAQSVQDGTHASPPINPVIPAIKELQDEVEDVISGFNARLRKIKRSGARIFGSSEDLSGDDEDESISILPIQNPAQTESPAEAGVPPVMIGRGKEEVEAALNRVADLDAEKTSAPDEPKKIKDADAVAQSLKDAVASEQVSASSPLHQEL